MRDTASVRRDLFSTRDSNFQVVAAYPEIIRAAYGQYISGEL